MYTEAFVVSHKDTTADSNEWYSQRERRSYRSSYGFGGSALEGKGRRVEIGDDDGVAQRHAHDELVQQHLGGTLDAMQPAVSDY